MPREKGKTGLEEWAEAKFGQEEEEPFGLGFGIWPWPILSSLLGG